MLEYYLWTAIKMLLIMLMVLMVAGAVLIVKYDSNFGRKIFYPSAALCALINMVV